MPEPNNLSRRKVLMRWVQGFSITGLGFLAYPFFKVLMPGLSEDGYLDVEFGELRAGEFKSVAWLGRTVIVFKRGQRWLADGPEEIELKDPESVESQQPSFAQNAARSYRDDVFIFYSNCTHLGCEVAIAPERREAPIQCPCHQSGFDASGRVLRNAAASLNLEVPNYRPVSANAVRLERSRPT